MQTAEENSYYNMLARCYNPKHPRYKDYGGRGITVCAEWLNSKDKFLLDMGPKPFYFAGIDRIDNNKGYSKDNCKWSSAAVNNRNRRDSSSSGHKNIYYRNDSAKPAYYQVKILWNGINRCKSFNKLEDAITWRDAKLKEMGRQ